MVVEIMMAGGGGEEEEEEKMVISKNNSSRRSSSRIVEQENKKRCRLLLLQTTTTTTTVVVQQQQKEEEVEEDDEYFGDTKKPTTTTTTTTRRRSLKSKKTATTSSRALTEKNKKKKAAPIKPTSSEQLIGEEEKAAAVAVDKDAEEEEEAGLTSLSLLGDTSKVIQTIRTFNQHYLHFVQEEEKRVNIREAERKVAESTKANKKGGAQEGEIKRGSKRPDLKATAKMRDTGAILNPEKRIGAIPGINVGYQFYSRAEMVVVGFHSHWLSGIDYIGQGAKGYDGYTLPLAIAIVLSGGYEDDLDNCEDVIYTGSGGNDLLGNKRQIADQVMTRGNLALKNCIEQETSVRVIRGHQSKSSYVGKIYTYDGLYKVHSNWAEKGVSGFTVYKFRLKRVDGQPQLTTNQVHFTNGRVPNSVSEVRGLVCKDISGGLETIPIPATNMVDDPAVPPTDYTYHKTMIVAKSVKLPKAPPGCGCRGSCIDPKKCACAKLNGSDFPYVQRNGGRLIEPKSVVFECGPHCGCGPECVNRTSQRGIKYRLEVFRTPNKGWGVRSWDFIPSGAPICEYIGKLMRTEETDSAHDNFYIIDCDTLETMAGLDGRQSRLKDVSLPSHMLRNVKDRTDCDPEYCVDASTKGNVARYINHSCQPNLFIQSVLSDHHELSQARIVLFAADNIPPLTELTYDYAYIIDSVMGPDGNPKNVACYCGADDCRKRLL